MYAFTEIGGILAGEPAYPTALNDSNEVVGWASTSTGPHGFHWSKGVTTDLGSFTSTADTYANDINNSGVIVGGCYSQTVAPTPNTAVRWDAGVMTALPMPRRYKQSATYSINNNGDISGSVVSSSDRTEACVWFANGSVEVLGAPPAARALFGNLMDSWATTINDSGDVLVDVHAYSGPHLPAVWSGGTWTLLTNAPIDGWAMHMNDLNLVVGMNYWWDEFSGMHSLGSPNFSDSVSLYSVTKSGLAVGCYDDGWTALRAELSNNTVIDLNAVVDPSLPWQLTDAVDINEFGSIIGQCVPKGTGGVDRAYLLQPLTNPRSFKASIPYTPPRKLPTHIWPGDPAEIYKGTPAQRAQRALKFAARLLEGKERKSLETLAAKLRGIKNDKDRL